ncbi:MAG: Rrf2 family transcriptional regulator [bacterium]|nr:Rrf2 family transcriptional regulator [bacterium]
MRLTNYADYALRVLIYLGVHRERLVQKAEIAESFGISANHLGKVVNHLARKGFIEAKRGRGGGLELGAEPDKIVVGEVVGEFEPDFHIVECFDAESNACPIAPVCGLGGILGEAEEAFQSVLDGYTLADILGAPGRGRYKKLLSRE